MLQIAADWGKPPYEILKDPGAVRWILRWQAKARIENQAAKIRRKLAESRAKRR